MPNNASNLRTDPLVRSRFSSVTKDVRLQLRPANRTLDFSRLRFKSVYSRSRTDLAASEGSVRTDSGSPTESIPTGSSRAESSRTDSPRNGSPRTDQNESFRPRPPRTELIRTDPAEPSPAKLDSLANLCLSLRSDNPFFSGIEAMPDIRPRKKSIPLVSELVLKVCEL